MRVTELLATGIEPLNPRDADFVYNESDGHLGHLLAVYLFDTANRPEAEFSREQAIEWVNARLGHHRMFTHTIRRVPLGLEHPHWAPAPNFDIRDHVQVTAIAESGWAPLQQHLDVLLATRMDPNRPPWELHFYTGVHGLDDLPGRLTVVVLKAHHSAGDGLAVLELAQNIFSDNVRPADADRVVPFLRGRMLAKSVLGLPGQLRRFAKDIPGNRAAGRAMNAAEVAGEWAQLNEQPAIRFNGKVSGSGSLAPIVLPANSIRRIKDTVPGATINDVLLAIVGGALGRYLGEKGEPHKGSLVAMVPRSMRKVEEWESANRLAVMGVDLHTDIDDPLGRLTRIAQSSKSEKTRTSHLAVRRLAAAVETAPPPMLRLIAYARKTGTHDLSRPRYQHTMVSNMPFSIEGFTLNGAPAVAVLGAQPPVDGDGLRHFVVTTADGSLMLTVVADSATMPDLDHYLDLIRASLTELEEAAAGATKQTPSDEIAS
ncbi:wax ester/triacylglycerol synthase domain-containing protein [Prescottella agglutinans]|uniref:diacylglycerol O-acyltransferase n=1 Tax=Prescottella agglutinans TaxID=1644129 RepID=A0ABT6M723_9NOCA|nr:wax ester/triacylglycerol synthase domain-containing protein [Prescottella agglutinans]MDH6280112.1 diacylglycerol O-acyltransferase [Prescottella agglutinans]